MSRRNKNAKEYMQGWCTTCKAFTRDSTEPDAEGYDCPDCDENTVEGAENALVNGDIEPCEEQDE